MAPLSVDALTGTRWLDGPVGRLEVAVDRPQGLPVGVAIIAHPHPLHGGTMSNKVVQTLARAHVLAGWAAVRFNFRGVGQSEGAYDDGRGEQEDMRAVIEAMGSGHPLCLAGFSFGAFVTSQMAVRLCGVEDLRSLVLVGSAVSRFDVAQVPQVLQERSLVVHGEEDEVVPLSSVMDWARPQSLPVTVVPGVGHFFHGRLPLLRELVWRHLRGAAQAASSI